MSYSFYKERKEWSEIKHRLLGKYLVPYCLKLGSRNEEIFYIDGFAGKGKYEDGSKGSPLIAANHAKRVKAEKRRFTLRCINVESNKSYFEELQRHTSNLERDKLVSNIPGKFEDSIERILGIIKSSPAFFFIDPFGPSPIKFNVLKPILEREASTELLINFSLIGLQRLAGNLYAKITTEKMRKAAETKVNIVSQVLNTDEWIKIWHNELDLVKRQEKILSLYKDNLSNYFNYVYAYPIRKTIKSQPKYFLVFASRHFDAIELMNDFICDEEERLRLHTYRMKGLFETQEREQLFQEVKNEIYLLGVKAKQITRKNIRQKLIPSRFGDLKKKEYNRAVKELNEEGHIKRMSDKAIKDDELLEFCSEERSQ